MNKAEFLHKLGHEIRKLPKKDIRRSLDFYSELIDDHTDEGMSEEEAIEMIGTPCEAGRQILMDAPLGSLVRARLTPSKPLRGWVIAVLICASPVLLPLAITAFALFLSVFTVIWTVTLMGYVMTVALGASAIGFCVGAPFVIANGSPEAGLLFIGAALICAGLTIVTYLLSALMTRGGIRLSACFVQAVKKMLIKKEKRSEEIQ